MVFVSVVADAAEVVVSALRTLPADTEDRLLPACVTHRTVVFDARGSGIQDPEIVGTGAAVVGRRPVVPDDHHFLRRLKIADGAYVTLATVLKKKEMGNYDGDELHGKYRH